MPNSIPRPVAVFLSILLVVLVVVGIVGLALHGPVATGDDDDRWLSSIDAGLARSAELGRPVLMVFR